MFPLLIPMAIGAGLGALTNKKNPLGGAMLGATVGAAGGSMAPGLLGGADAAAAYGTGLGTQQSAMLAAQDAAFGGSTALSQGVAEAGGAAMGAMKPVGQAMQTAQLAKGLLGGNDQAPIMPSPVMTPMPNSNLGQMVASQQQLQAQEHEAQQQAIQQRKAMRRGLR